MRSSPRSSGISSPRSGRAEAPRRVRSPCPPAMRPRKSRVSTLTAESSHRAAPYVYCVLAATRPPRLSRVPRGLPGLGPVRLLAVEAGLFAAVASAPTGHYGEAAIRRCLGDMDQVSRAALAHEAVVASFASETAVLPMKLFTLFASDARVVE